MKVRGVVIAAGESSRFGTAKALLQLQERTVLERVTSALDVGGCDELFVVCGGSYRQVIEQEAQRLGIRSVLNEDPSDGPVSSIRVAIQSSGEWDGILVQPVDVVGVQARDVSDLIGAFRESSSDFDAWIISHQMRRGHPILLTRKIAMRLLANESPPHLRALLASGDVRIQHIVSENPLVLEDVDDPADWQRISPLLSN